MTDIRDKPEATDRWRATIDALEAVLLTALTISRSIPRRPERSAAWLMLQTARRRRNTLPAAWARRPGMLPQIVPDAEPTPKATGPDEPTPRSPDRPAARPTAWHE